VVDGAVPLVALIGAPRSGTTWLQNLLGADPRVVTPQETSLFSRYVAPLDESWRWGLRGTADDWARRRFSGLSAALTEDEFTALVRDFVQQALQRILLLKPGAEVVLEKTPSHSLHVELIARFAPQVRFLHIIRDGRDVAASLVDAARGWGSAWGAPGTVDRAARTWVEYLSAARHAQEVAPYHEVRYEQLRGQDGLSALRQIFEFCGAPIDESEARRRFEEYSFQRQQSSGVTAVVFGGEAIRHAAAGSEPEGFFRRGDVGGWSDNWTLQQRVEFDDIAGDMLVALGYESDDRWLGNTRAVARARRALVGRRRVARVLGGAGRKLERSARGKAASTVGNVVGVFSRSRRSAGR
jgi:hypothetical protein